MQIENKLKIPDSYNFQKYDKPRKGLFKIEKPNGNYNFPQGWESIEKEYVIIGECNLNYTYRIIESETNEYGKKNKKYLTPLGIHKSRLIKWIDGQQIMEF